MLIQEEETYQVIGLCMEVHKEPIVEIKPSPDGIADEHLSQTLNYMKASGSQVDLIVNFGKRKLEYNRLVI